ncbi:class E sortase [uncultured Kocuria sp.]|uniref:class E sortase n=1 Tax=uncultured Kocuria sp. TaxID=259305 RepID=UPI002636204E|nr:class E sortase [uncultured Kocuria sp.]
MRRAAATTSLRRPGTRSRSGGRTAAERRRTAGPVLLMVLGLTLLLVPAWHLWWSDLAAGRAQEHAVARMSDRLDQVRSAEVPAAEGVGEGPPPVTARPPQGELIGIVYVPRFGRDYARPVAEGADPDVLDTLGLGHYPSTAMPGELGNVAIAGHRQSNGKALDLVHTLRPGDHIHVRTAEAYYTYTYRGSEVVAPDETRVLAPDPDAPTADPTERILTLTTCHPRYGATERFVGRAVLTSWRPASSGPPAEIAAAVAATGRT